MAERTTVRLPEDLLRRAKRKAADEGRSLTSLIEDGLRRVVADEGQRAPSKPKPIPVSKATGGLLPGVDITKFSDIEGMDDLEYAERLKSGFK
jgi:Ribbon-helix-helix protein, copG family